MSLLTCRRRGVGKSLPYDAEVEYLHFNGNCSINTKYIPYGNDIRIKTKIKYIGYRDTSGYLSWFSAYTNEGTGTHSIIRNGISDTDILVANGGKAGGGRTSFTVFKNTIYEIDINRSVCDINNTRLTLSTFNIQNSGVLTIGSSKAYLWYYYFQLYKDDELILDLIPVRKGNVGYMYDKVSGQLFENSGSGSFVLGNDK